MRADPAAKVLATLLFVVVVAVTPAREYWAFAAYAGIVVAVAVAVRVPPLPALRRFGVEVPFVAYAILMPLVGQGPRVDVGPLSLSEAGLLAAWSLLAKATIGVAAAIVLAATTPVPDLLSGLERLRVPRRLVAIAGFMVRYGDVLAAELHRMRVARLSRGDDPRWLWQARAVASSIGLLFVRSYERGERVALAMASRGYTGTMPARCVPSGVAGWIMPLAIPAAAGGILARALT